MNGRCPHGVYVWRSTDCPACWNAEHPDRAPLRALPGGGVGYEVPGLEDTFERVDPDLVDAWAQSALDSDPDDTEREAP